jgi:serine/threonine-protein kinase
MSNGPTRIGRYEILHPIYGGGMASVFKAHDPQIDRDVCIKQVRDELDAPDLRELFLREVRAAGKLRHPNIVDIYDTGEFDGRPFIVMEYVPGKTLASLIGNRTPLSLGDRLRLMEQLCDGLACAHRAGIVHRDIKPANLIVDETGALKILDFGIARLSETGPVSRIIGTINYMSPEQWAGGELDRRSDIFSAGAVCYELLTHQQAFPGETAPEVYTRLAAGPPRPVEALCPDLDPRIATTVRRMLEPKAEHRPQWLEPVRDEFQQVRLATAPAPDPLFAPTLRLDTSQAANDKTLAPPAPATPLPTLPRASQVAEPPARPVVPDALPTIVQTPARTQTPAPGAPIAAARPRRVLLWSATAAVAILAAAFAGVTYYQGRANVPPAAVPVSPADAAPAPAASPLPAAVDPPPPAAAEPRTDAPAVQPVASQPAPPAAAEPPPRRETVTPQPLPRETTPAAASGVTVSDTVEPAEADQAAPPRPALRPPPNGMRPGQPRRPGDGRMAGPGGAPPGPAGRGGPQGGAAVPPDRRPMVRARCAQLLEKMSLGEVLTEAENRFRIERCRE